MHIIRRSIPKGGKDGPKGFMKKVTSSFSIRKKKTTTTTTTNDPKPKPLLPRSKSTGGNYESMRLPQGMKKCLPDVKIDHTKRNKSAGVSPQRRREKIDESANQFMKMRCFDDNDSIWLSSDCASPTSLLEERRVSVSFHFSVDEKIVSWLSNVAKTSLSLNQESTTEKIRKDGKLCNSVGTSSGKACPRKSSSFSSNNKRPSPEEKKVSFSVEETEKSLLPATNIPEIGDSNRKIVVEPLFWPFEQKFDWTPEDILKHFSMSPRRKKSLGTSPRSMRAQLQTRKLELKESCKRKLMFNGPGGGSHSKPTRIPEINRTLISNKKTEMSKNHQEQQQPIRNIVKRNTSLPSRLRKSSKISSKVVPIEAGEDIGEISKEQKTPKKLIMTRKSRTFLEDDFALMNDFSIENAVGLCEFKGREGIDSDFNTDGFLFDDSL